MTHTASCTHRINKADPLTTMGLQGRSGTCIRNTSSHASENSHIPLESPGPKLNYSKPTANWREPVGTWTANYACYKVKLTSYVYRTRWQETWKMSFYWNKQLMICYWCQSTCAARRRLWIPTGVQQVLWLISHSWDLTVH